MKLLKIQVTVWCVLLGVSHPPAFGNVDLELRAGLSAYGVGETVEFGLYVASDSGAAEVVRGIQAILVWDSAHLELLGVDNNGPYQWSMSGFYDDSALDGLNNALNDGDAYYQAVGNFVSDALAPPEGLLVTTLQFRALSATPVTQVSFTPDLEGQVTTVVLGNPGENITGLLGNAVVAIAAQVDWGELAVVVAPDAPCCVAAGDTVTVLLTISSLLNPVNGIQALISFDETMLALNSILPGDGSGSPWDSAVEVHGTVNDVIYTVLSLPGSSTADDSVAARLEFTALFGGMPALASVELVAESSPLVSKLTDAGSAAAIIPALQGPAVVSHVGDSDADGDIDVADRSVFETCFGASAPLGACCCADFDADEDVDCVDWDEFVLAWTGPGTPDALAPCVSDIPAVSTWGLCVIALLLLVEGTVRLRKVRELAGECSVD